MSVNQRRIDIAVRVLVVVALIFGCFDSALLYRNWQKSKSTSELVDSAELDLVESTNEDPAQMVTINEQQYEPVYEDISGMDYEESKTNIIPPIIADKDISISAKVDPSVISITDTLHISINIQNNSQELKQDLVFNDYLNKTLNFSKAVTDSIIVNTEENSISYQIQELAAGEELILEYDLKINTDYVAVPNTPQTWVHSVYIKSADDVSNEGYQTNLVWILDQSAQSNKTASILSSDGGWSVNDGVSIYTSENTITSDSVLVVEQINNTYDGPELQFGLDLFALDKQSATETNTNESQYELNPEQMEVFSDPVYLQVDFNSLGELANLPSGVEPYIATFDEEAKVWVKVPLEKVDYEGNTISAYASHFSVWGAGLGSSLPQNGANVLLFDQPYVSLFTGRASYSLPISAPAGRADFSPSVSLSYSSRTVDGVVGDVQAPWVGMGWNIDAIEIVRKITTDEDGFGYENDFALTINGTVYSLLEDPILKGRYHTEDASFYYIQRHNPALGNDGGVQNTTKEWWEVISPSGIHYRLGWTNDSEQLSMMPGYYCMTGYPCTVPSGAYTSLGYAGTGADVVAMRWRVDQIRDTHYNYIQYTYQEETKNVGSIQFDHASYLSSIDYTGHLNSNDGSIDNSVPMPYQIRFNLENRPDDIGDNPSGRVYDWDNFENKRLDSIEIIYHCDLNNCVDTRTDSNDVILRTYDFTYDVHQIPSADGTQVLSAVNISAGGYTENGESVEYVSLPAVTFDYTDKANQAETNPLIEHYVYPRLTGVDNGFGADMTFEYERDDRAETYWYNYRVKNVLVDNGFDDARKISYTYHDPVYIDNLKELLGFSYVDQFTYDFDQTTKLSFSRHTYSTTYPDYGKETQTIVYDPSNNSEYLKTVNTWSGNNTGVPTGVNFRYISQVTNYQYNGSSLQQTGINKFAYNPYTGNLTEKRTYVGGSDLATSTLYTIEHYEYAINNDVNVHMTDRLLRSTLTDGNGNISADTRYMYDTPASTVPTLGDVTLVQNITGINTSITVDTGYSYDDFGNVTGTINYASYGEVGQIPEYDGSSDQKSIVEYDSTYHMLPVTTKQIISPYTEGNTPYETTSDLLFSLGTAKSTTDANGETISYTYDGLGRQLTSTANGIITGSDSTEYKGYTSKTIYPSICQEEDPDNCANYHVLEMQIWDPIGENQQGVVSPGYRSIWGIYDGQGVIRQTQMILPDGSVQLVDVSLNAQGLTDKQSEPYTASVDTGTYASVDWNAVPYSSSTYDFMGRITQSTAPDGRSSQYSYPFYAKETIDAGGHKKRYEYDFLDRLVKVKEYTGSTPNFEMYSSMEYKYDVYNNLISVTDQEGSQTKLGYDWLGRKLFIKSPDMGFWSYDYNALGSLTRQNDARDETVCLYYDQLNRLTGKTYAQSGSCTPSPSTEDLVVSFGFGDGTTGKPYGYRTSMQDETGTTSWDYSNSARTISETRLISGRSYQFTTYSDYLGRVYRENDPGEQVDYHYDITGRVVGLDADEDKDLIQLAYNTFSQIDTMTFQQNGHQVTRENTYNATYHRLDEFKIYNGSSYSEENSLMNFSYQYDLLDNILSISDSQLEDEYTFTYDDVNRLVSAQSMNNGDYNYKQEYSYDATGNILSVSDWRYTYYPAGVYEDDFTGISMGQNWTAQTTSSASGENEHASSTTGAEISFYFNGTGIGYVRRVGPDQGMVDVYIDNEPVDSIDNYADTEAYQQLAVIPVEAGKHKLQLKVSESQNAMSTGNTVNLDYLQVFDNLPASTATPTLTYTPSLTSTPTYAALFAGSYQENDGVINFSGSWQENTGAYYAGNAQVSTNSSGASFTFLFTGNRFELLHSVGPDHGIAEICFDANSLDETCQNADFYNADSFAQINTSYEVPYGMHVIRVSHTGLMNGNATDSFISIDQLNIISDTPTESPTPSDTPTITDTPSETPVPSETPIPSDTPVLSDTPEASDTPEISSTPETSETLAESNTPEFSATPSPTLDGSETATDTPTVEFTNTPGSDTETPQPSFTYTPSLSATYVSTTIPTEVSLVPHFVTAMSHSQITTWDSEMSFSVPGGGNDRVMLVALQLAGAMNEAKYKIDGETDWLGLTHLKTITGSGGKTIGLYYTRNLPQTTKTMYVSASSLTYGTIYMGAAVYDQVDPTDPFSRIESSMGTGTTAHTDIYANADEMAVGVVGNWFETTLLSTPESGQMKLWQQGQFCMGQKLGSIAMDWTTSDREWGQIVISLKPNHTLEDTDSRFDYSGSWDTVSNSSFSGGTEHIANTAGEEVNFHFYGNQLMLYYAKDTNRGIVQVCIDEGTANELCQNVDQYSATFAAKQTTAISVNQGGHTVVMRYTGTHNSNSGGFDIGLDKVSVAEFHPTVTPTSTVTLTPTITLTSVPSFTYTPSLSPTFDPTSVPTEESLAPRFLNAASYSKVETWKIQKSITVSGGGDDRILLVAVQSYGALHYAQYAYSGIGWTDLTLIKTITNSNGSTIGLYYTRNIPSADTYVTVQAYSYEYGTQWISAAVFDRVDPSTPISRITSSLGTGTTAHTDIYANPDELAVGVVGNWYGTALLNTPVTGQIVAWQQGQFAMGYQQGSDDMDWTTSNRQWGQILISLKPNHTLEDTDSRFDYIGTWDTASNTSFSNGTEHMANALEEEVRFHFYGNQLKLFYAKDMNRGIAQVCIDEGTASEQCQNIDQYAETIAAKQSTTINVAQGGHSVVIRYTGTRNQDAEGFIVGLDKISVAEFIPTVTPTFTPTFTPTYTPTLYSSVPIRTSFGTRTISESQKTGFSYDIIVPSGGDNRLLLVHFAHCISGNVTSMTYNGIALTRLLTTSNAYADSEIWYLKNPPSGAYYRLTVARSNTGDAHMNIITMSDVNMIDTFGFVNGITGTGTVMQQNFSSDPNDYVMDMYNYRTGGQVTTVAGIGQQVLSLLHTVRRNQAGFSVKQGATEMSWSWPSATGWTHQVVVLHAMGFATPTPTLTPTSTNSPTSTPSLTPTPTPSVWPTPIEQTPQTAGVYQESDSAWFYTGFWSNITGSNDSGGARKEGTQSWAAAQLSFTGNQITYTFRKGPQYGIAELYVGPVDGSALPEKVASIDQYNAAELANQSLTFTLPASDEPRVLVIRRSERKNPDSSGLTINLDAITIGTAAETTLAPTGSPTPFPGTATATATPVGINVIYNADYNGSAINASHPCNIPEQGSNRILMVGLGFSGPGYDIATADDLISITYAGQPLQLAAQATNNNVTQMWYLVNPPAGWHSLNITFNETKYYRVGMITFNGVDQYEPIRNFSVNEQFACSISSSITSPSGDVALSVFTGGPGDSERPVEQKVDEMVRILDNGDGNQLIMSRRAGVGYTNMKYSWDGCIHNHNNDLLLVSLKKYDPSNVTRTPTISPTPGDSPTVTPTSSTPTALPTSGMFTQNYHYDASQPHAVTGVDREFRQDKFTYDANGNQTTRLVDGLSYTLAYDEENRIESVKLPVQADIITEQIWTFHYDGNGTRIRQGNPDGSQLLLLNGGRYHVEIAADSSESTTRYYSIAGQHPAMRNNDGSINYLLGDHLGSVSTVVDASGEIVSQSRYLPFGEVLWTKETSLDDNTSTPAWGYTGQRSLSDIGLMDYNARFYDPMLGRFTSPDSIIPDPGSVIGYNRYAYVHNNPLIYTDPSGHFINLGFAAVGAIIGAATGVIMSAGPQMIQNIQQGQPLTANIEPTQVLKDAAIGAAVGAVGGLTFGLGLAAGTAVAGAIGISGSSGVLASVAGGVTVGLAGAAAGQTSRATQNILTGQPIGQGLGNVKDMAIDAAFSMFTFKLSGANFRQIVPADYTSLGPFADKTMPSKYPNKTTVTERSFVQGEQCHTCGEYAPKMIADHVPPRGPVIAPQCPACSCRQGGLVSQGKNAILPNHIWSGKWWNASWAPYWKIWDRKDNVK
jgi:RHS repeat-associated protein